MIYKTHILVSHCVEGDNTYYLVEGIEYPNLLTQGETLEKAKEMAVDAWSLLCVVYEDKNVDIQSPYTDRDIGETRQFQWLFEIESEDTIEYRKYCSKPNEKSNEES